MTTTYPGQIARCILDGGAARLVAALTTPAVREAVRRHDATRLAALALARGATAGLLLSTLTKDQERVTLQLLGDGPFGGITVDASSSGEVRAFLRNPKVRPPIALDAAAAAAPGGGARRLSVAAGVGSSGIVNVVRDLGLRETFSGQTPLVSGEIDEDVEHYLAHSEQIESALVCDALVDDRIGRTAEQRIEIAGGLLVQALPGSGGAALVEATRDRLRDGGLMRALARGPATAEALARELLGRNGYRDADGDGEGDGAFARLDVLDVRPVTFHCPCSRERAASSLMLLGGAELGEMILDDGKAEVTCDFCRERYDFTEAELETLRREATGPAGPAS
jgi:molecular chaperone Hsp33